MRQCETAPPHVIWMVNFRDRWEHGVALEQAEATGNRDLPVALRDLPPPGADDRETETPLPQVRPALSALGRCLAAAQETVAATAR